MTDLVIVAVDADALGKALKCERSRGGAVFPHLYALLPLTAVKPIRMDDGRPILPRLEG